MNDDMRENRAGRRSLHGDRPNVGELPLDQDVRKEVDFHIAMRTRELIEEGWDPGSAREEALRLFGDVDEVRREMTQETKKRDRAVRRAHALDGVIQDLKYALRGLRRSPGFAAVGILTLALGIGANTAIFSVVNGVLLKPLPFEDPGELVLIRERSEQFRGMGVAWPNFVDWREQGSTLEQVSVFTAHPATFLGSDRPVRGRVARVSGSFFELLGVEPRMGRTMLAEEHQPGADPAAVVSHAFWRDEMGGDPDFETRTLEATGYNFRVVGVLPPGFDFPANTDLWFPVEIQIFGPQVRTAHNYTGLGRLASGTALGAAREELSTITAQANEGNDSPYAAKGVVMESLHEATVGDVRTPLLLLLGAAGLVLLVACSNLASTFLARATGRQREIAVRASLGATRPRLLRQLATEAMTLAVLGGGAGILAGAVLVQSLVAVAPASIPRLDQVGLEPRVLAFTAGITVLTALLFGLAPALRLSAGNVAQSLRSGDRGSSGHSGDTVWRILVASEVALALMVLVGSGLLIRSFVQVLDTEAGFRADDVLAVNLSLPPTRYGSDAATAGFYADLLREVRALPGVEVAGMIYNPPLDGGRPNGQVGIEDGQTETADGVYQVADGRYFEALEIPVLRGRVFQESDEAGEHVVVVSEGFARLAWGDEDPLGKRMNGGGMDNYRDTVMVGGEPQVRPTWARVIGVVADVRENDLTREPEPTYYFYYKQRPRRAGSGSIVIRTTGNPAPLVAPLRQTVRAVGPDVPVQIRRMQEVVARSVADRQFTMLILAAFALSALVLAAVGIYGVVSYAVARRTREMGIRLALGAAPGQVRTLVQKGAMATVVLGVAAGIVGAVFATRLMESLLFGVGRNDPLTMGGVVVVLVGTAWLASWIPARRSTRVDPMITMRAE